MWLHPFLGDAQVYDEERVEPHLVGTSAAPVCSLLTAVCCATSRCLVCLFVERSNAPTVGSGGRLVEVMHSFHKRVLRSYYAPKAGGCDRPSLADQRHHSSGLSWPPHAQMDKIQGRGRRSAEGQVGRDDRGPPASILRVRGVLSHT